MTGRGIDQILPHPSHPQLHESYIKSSKDYVTLAERVSGPISKPVNFNYIWGDALKVLDQFAPTARIINLETAITSSNDYWPGKGINYRMHPHNVPCLTSAKIDCCVLANNHVLDWGYSGLKETLKTLKNAHLKFAGAGHYAAEAETPTIIDVTSTERVIVFALGETDSGIPTQWRSGPNTPGIHLLTSLNEKEALHLAEKIRVVKKNGDVVIVSIHWGGNWGYEILEEQKQFAHLLIDLAPVNVIHGHSSHHPKGIEIYKNKPILYGCGDFLNDYEGISGYQEFRGDLTLMYLLTIDPLTGDLMTLTMVPMQIKHFRLNSPSSKDIHWLHQVLDRECRALGSTVRLNGSGHLELQFSRQD